MEWIMKIFGYKKMKYIRVYLDVYGEFMNYHELLLPFKMNESSIITILNTHISKENSICSWRIYDEEKTWKKKAEKPRFIK